MAGMIHSLISNALLKEVLHLTKDKTIPEVSMVCTLDTSAVNPNDEFCRIRYNSFYPALSKVTLLLFNIL